MNGGLDCDVCLDRVDHPPHDTYLNDPEHEWLLEPDLVPSTLPELFAEIADREWSGIDLILQGYAGLKQRHPEATDVDCLTTSMVWWYG